MSICVVCSEDMTGQAGFDLGGKLVHKDCFKCGDCDKHVDVAQYHEKDGKFYHPKCFFENHVPHCHGCDKSVDPSFLKVGDKLYHKECFKCGECDTPLDGKYHVLEGTPTCDGCWEKLAPKCFICKKKVLEKKIVAAHNIVFHPECFKCTKCGEQLETGEFVPKGNNVYHVKCYNPAEHDQ